MLVTLFGIVTDVKTVHWMKANSPMLVTLIGHWIVFHRSRDNSGSNSSWPIWITTILRRNLCRLVGGIEIVIQVADLDSLIVPGEQGSYASYYGEDEGKKFSFQNDVMLIVFCDSAGNQSRQAYDFILLPGLAKYISSPRGGWRFDRYGGFWMLCVHQ